MKLPARAWFLTAALLTSAFAGCATFGGKDQSPSNAVQRGQWEPKASEGEHKDKWGYVGKEGRGNRPLEDERDPLKNLIMSEEARDIERNLGYK